MTGRRRLVAAVACAAVAAIGILSSPLVARESAPMTVREGAPASGRYPAIVGVQAAHGAPDLEQCRAGAGCDVVPLVIDEATFDRQPPVDSLLTITVRWDPADGNVLNAALFDDAQLAAPDSGARNEVPGLVKWTTGGRDGSLVLRAANVASGRYQLAVASITGTNRGFDVAAQITSHAAATATDTAGGLLATAPPVAGRPGTPVTTASDTATAAADAPTSASAHGRGPDERFDGAVGVAASAPSRNRPIGVGLALVALALGLLGAVSAGTWRVSRPASTRPWFRDVRLFWKLMTPFVVVIIVVGVVGTFLTSRYLAGRAESEMSRRLVQADAATAGYLRDQEFALLDASRFAANVQGLPEALAAADAPGVERALASVAAVNDQLDVVASVGPDGRSLATLTRTGGEVVPHAGERWDETPPVQAVLSGVVDRTGDKHAGLIRLADGSTVLVVAAPVRTDAVVGAVVVGRRTGPIVDEASRRSDAAVALYDGSLARIASSDGAAPARLDAGIADGESRQELVASGGAEFGRLLVPLEFRGRRAATLVVSVPAGSSFDAVRGTAIRLGVLVALGLAAIMAIGAVLSRSILRSVQPLLATNRALGRGDLGARAPVHGNDELGELAEGFNQMAEQLEASYQQLERRVDERTEELQHLYRAREEFFASVSHELRTPLFAILANSEMLTDPALAPDDPAERDEFVGTIHTSARQLVTTVNDLLDLAKAEEAAVRLALGDVDPADVLDEVTTTLVALGRAADVTVALDRSPRLRHVRADRDRLVQILLNLGSNAVKNTPEGGSVVITAHTAGDVLEVVVADTGLGIPAEVGDRIFEPYYVVERDSLRAQPSTGLGLAITKRLVAAHGGTIEYISEPRAGTTFTVRLPLGGAGTDVLH